MQKVYHICCPKCNKHSFFYRYDKDSDVYQKYLCRKCRHQFAPDRPDAGRDQIGRPRQRDYPVCPVCGKATFLHRDYEYYGNYRCCEKRCNHSFFVWKNTAIAAPSMSSLFGKHDFKRMRYPVHLIVTALSMFYLGKNPFRNISLRICHGNVTSIFHSKMLCVCVSSENFLLADFRIAADKIRRERNVFFIRVVLEGKGFVFVHVLQFSFHVFFEVVSVFL